MSVGLRACGRLAAGCLLALGLGTLTAGCGSSKGQVSGKVLEKDGEPLPGGRVSFVPEGGGMAVTATIREGGTYEAPGLVPGRYKVSVTTEYLNPARAKGKFLKPGDEGVGPQGEAKGKKKEDQEPPAEAKDGPPKEARKGPPTGQRRVGDYVPLDPRNADPEQSGLTCEVKAGSQEYDIRLKY